MNLNKDYKIESEGLNVTIFKNSKPKKKNDGTMTKGGWSPVAYFSRLDNALIEYLQIRVKETELKDLKSVLKRIDDVEAEIIKALKEK